MVGSDQRARDEEECSTKKLKAQRAAEHEKRLRNMRDAHGEGGIATPERRATPGVVMQLSPFFKTNSYAQGPFTMK